MHTKNIRSYSPRIREFWLNPNGVKFGAEFFVGLSRDAATLKAAYASLLTITSTHTSHSIEAFDIKPSSLKIVVCVYI